MTEGKIMIDGTDIRDITQHELREKLGYVPQKGVLFSGTIKSNILYGNKDGTEEEMLEAAQVAQASGFIEEKPEGYESHIAQGGSNVSGGQKQRLSIARAIARHPDVFIFDDSFSALDYKTDVTLRKELKNHTAESTVILVAQRISTILHAEQIVVLDEGEVAGIGTHKGAFEKIAKSIGRLLYHRCRRKNLQKIWMIQERGILNGWRTYGTWKRHDGREGKRF